MQSKKIELQASDMAKAIGLAKEQKLEMIIDKFSCEEYCIARISYMNTRQGHEALIKLMREIHALELAQIRKAIPKTKPLNLHLLITSKKQRT